MNNFIQQDLKNINHETYKIAHFIIQTAHNFWKIEFAIFFTQIEISNVVFFNIFGISETFFFNSDPNQLKKSRLRFFSFNPKKKITPRNASTLILFKWTCHFLPKSKFHTLVFHFFCTSETRFSNLFLNYLKNSPLSISSM